MDSYYVDSIDPNTTCPSADLRSAASADPRFTASADPRFAASADPRSATSVIKDLLQVLVNAVAKMTEAGKETKESRQKDAERVIKQANKMRVYKKRGVDGWRGPSEIIANQMRKKEDPNGPGKQPETTLDVYE
ncbi:hypothetical protein Tco_1490630 [Tanacetum coccineum]